MNLKEIRELIELMEDHGLTEVDLEKDGTKIRLKKGPTGVIQSSDEAPAQVNPAHSTTASPATIPAETKKPAEDENLAVILSPMVGTFYRQPAPGAKPCVEVGDRVSEGSILCILEAMKLMNEVKSEYNGVIEEILVENLQPVEFGQPLFVIRKS